MDFASFKDTALQFVATGAITYLAWQVNRLVESVATLNVKMAEVVAHMENQKDKIEDHDIRIRELERA